MNPFDAIGNFALGLIKNNQLQKLVHLAVSIAMTGLIGFPMITGGTALTLMFKQNTSWQFAFAVGFATACTTVPVYWIRLWQAEPEAKGIPLAWSEDTQKKLEETSVVIDQNKKG